MMKNIKNEKSLNELTEQEYYELKDLCEREDEYLNEDEIERIDVDAVDNLVVRDAVPGYQNCPPKIFREGIPSIAPIRGKVMVHQRKVGNIKPLYNPMEDERFNINESKEYEKIVDVNNLVVYRGRAITLARMFNKDLVSDTEPFTNMKDRYISFLAIGSGGADSVSILQPNKPNATDYELVSHGDVTGLSPTGARYATINGRTYHLFDDDYPQFLVDDEIGNNTDVRSLMDQNNKVSSYERDSYLVAKVKVTLSAGEANGVTGAQNINECGLFLAPNNSLSGWGSYTKHLDLFARTTFPTIVKNSTRELVFSWFIFL